MRKDYLEVELIQPDDLSISPKRFQNEEDHFAKLVGYLNWGMFFVKGDNCPRYYMRNCFLNGYSSGNVCRPGNGPLEPQTCAHHEDMAQKGVETTTYSLLDEATQTYGISSKEPYSSFSYNQKGAHWVEGNFMDLNVEWYPYGHYFHYGSPTVVRYMQFHHHFTGTYDGQEIEGCGCSDRFFIGENDQFLIPPYVGSYSTGIREDGRREYCYCSIFGPNHLGYSTYWLEGEEPVFETTVNMEADWRRLPYTKEGDKSIAFTEAKWTIADKTVHGIGRFGSKGHTPRIRYDGCFTQVYGDWYEGDIPYKHRISHTLWEQHGIDADNAKDYDLKVID